MPYFSATYASNVDKIFATMGPYICQCDPDTGVLESKKKLVAGAIYGEMPICYHPATGMLFVGSGLTPTKQTSDAWFDDPPVYKDVYRVNPTTLAITECNLQLAIGGGMPDGLRGGPYQIIPDGDSIVFEWKQNGGHAWGRMNATTFAYVGADVFRFQAQQVSVDDTTVYTLDPYQREVQTYDKITGFYTGSPFVGTNTPLGIVYCIADGKNWIVCGDENLLRVNSYGVDNDFTLYDLSSILGPTAIPDPVRIRYCSDGLLYIPTIGADGVIVFNPLTGTGVWKSGFESPIDVVETDARKFAVQLAPIGLKEIL